MNIMAAFVGGFFFWFGCAELKTGMAAIALAIASKKSITAPGKQP